MEETRKIGDYSVKYSMYIGHKDIALGENPNADKDERYMCCFVETNAIFERYSGVLVSDDFAEIAKVFRQRVADAAEEIIQENERACQEVGMNEELMAESCAPTLVLIFFWAQRPNAAEPPARFIRLTIVPRITKKIRMPTL